jgi:signal transduction histidine kinase
LLSRPGYKPAVSAVIGRRDDFEVVLADDSDFVPVDDANSRFLEYLQHMKNRLYRIWERFWPLAQRYWFDGLLVVGIGVSIAAAVVDQGKKDGPQGPLWFDVLAAGGFVVPLFFRRRYPFGAPVATAVLLAATSFVDGGLANDDFIVFLAMLAGAFLLGGLKERTQAVAGLVILVGTEAILVHNSPQGPIGDFIWILVVSSIAWVIGFGLGYKFREVDEAKERAERLEREREEQARLAVADERARIARELHDVVGHSVSVMTVQASGVRRLLEPDQEREREALMVVEQTGREALAEMRRLVGVLRRPEEAPALAPQPSLEHLDKLVEQAREAGLPVELTVEGEPVQLAPGLDLTAYRFVQEGLTNALKHARAEHAEVLVRYDNGHVELTVSDDGTGDGGGESGGHGLVGMRERMSVYGGELESGPLPEGGYRLHARLPAT